MTEPVTKEEMAEFRAELGGIMQRLNETLAILPTMPEDARLAVAARLAARARGFFWTDEFAATVGRHRQWVSDRCNSRIIKTLPGDGPFRIPLSEDDRWNKLKAS